MDEMYNYVHELISYCDTFTSLVLSDNPYQDVSVKIYTGLAALLPKIADLYSLPQYSEHSDDVLQWINQTKRLLAAIKGNDIFFLLDVIDYEIKENLKELEQILLQS